MATRRVLISFDHLTDVVSVYYADSVSARARLAPHDGHMLLEYDERGDVVGAELQGVGRRLRKVWKSHPDRELLPREILSELDGWLSAHWADRMSTA